MNYKEMVKLAYEDIADSFEKEASTALMRYASKNPAKFPGAQRQGSFMPGLQKDMNSAVKQVNSAKSTLSGISSNLDYYENHADKIKTLFKNNPNMSPQHYQQNLSSLNSANKKIGELNTQYRGARNALDQARYNYTGAKMGVMRGGEIYKNQVMNSLPKNPPGKTLADIKAGAAAKLGMKTAAINYSNIGGLNKNYSSPQKPNVSNSLVGASADASRKLQSQSYLSDLRAKERAGFTTKPRNTFWDDMF